MGFSSRRQNGWACGQQLTQFSQCWQFAQDDAPAFISGVLRSEKVVLEFLVKPLAHLYCVMFAYHTRSVVEIAFPVFTDTCSIAEFLL